MATGEDGSAYSYDAELASSVAALPDLDLTDLAQTRARLAGRDSEALQGFDSGEIRIRDALLPGVDGEPVVPVRIYEPPAAAAGSVASLIYLHGGGFVVGSLDTVHADAAQIAAATGAAVVSVQYRLAPEHRFPAALKDCYTVLRRVCGGDAGFDADQGRIGIAGDSAGAGLAAGTTLLARDRDGPMACFQLLMMPALDDRLATPSMRRFVDTPMWDRSKARLSWQYYLPSELADECLTYAAPARADDLSGLPPAYVVTCEFDPLRDEGLDYARRLMAAGVSTEIHHYPRTFHGCTRIPHAGVSRRIKASAQSAIGRALGTHPATTAGRRRDIR